MKAGVSSLLICLGWCLVVVGLILTAVADGPGVDVHTRLAGLAWIAAGGVVNLGGWLALVAREVRALRPDRRRLP